MEAMKYRIVTTGEIHSGFSLQEVQKNLGGLCKYDKDKLERIFSGDLFVFESDIDLIAARRYKSSLDQTGIVCQIEPLTPINIKQEQTNHAPSSLPTPANSELSECPKCGAPYNGEEACSSCGVIPSKYLERQGLEQQVQAAAIEERSGINKTRILAVTLLAVIVLASAYYLLPKNYRYELSDRLAGLTAPNFDQPPNRFHAANQSDIIREYKDRGYNLDCYGNLRPEEKLSKSDDYVCWAPIRSAYNNIPAKMLTFSFAEGKLNRVRLEFPDSSFDEVQNFLGKKLGNERRLDPLPQYQSRTDIYGEHLMIWEVKDGFVTTSSKATPGRSFIILWQSRAAGVSDSDAIGSKGKYAGDAGAEGVL